MRNGDDTLGDVSGNSGYGYGERGPQGLGSSGSDWNGKSSSGRGARGRGSLSWSLLEGHLNGFILSSINCITFSRFVLWETPNLALLDQAEEGEAGFRSGFLLEISLKQLAVVQIMTEPSPRG